jgi:fibronectin-binding autotransporter adhesin
MKRLTCLIAAYGILAIVLTSARAADLFWDINGVNAGATDDAGGVASGDVSTTKWSTDSTGASATAAWVPGSRAVFSAGTNATGTSILTGALGTAGTTGTAVLSGILVEEGTIQVTGTLVVNTAANGGLVEVNAGTTLQQPSVNIVSPVAGASTTTIGAGFRYKLNGTTAVLENLNTGGAGSFISTTSGGIDLNGGGTLKFDQANVLNILQTSTITGTGPLIKEGAGVLAIVSTCSYTGATIINNGELRIRTSTNRLPTATDVTVNSPGVLNLNGVSQQVGSVAGTGNIGTAGATLTIGGSNSTTLDGAVLDTANAPSGTFPGSTAIFGRITRQGTGTTTINGVNDITGTVTVTSGGLTIGSAGSLCGDVADLVVNGGTLTLNQAAETVENFSGTGGSVVLNSTVLTTNPSDATASNTTYSGIISGSGGLKKTNYVWESSATSPNRLTISSTRNGEARILTLTGANTNTGTTEVVGGGIRVNNTTGSGLGTGAVNINTAGKIDGSGSIAGAITVNAGGHLGGGIGTANGTLLTANGAVTVNTGGNIDALLGATASTAGDFNGDLVVDARDYVAIRKAFADIVNPGAGKTAYDAYNANFGNTYSGLGTSDRVKVTTNSLTFASGSMVTVLGTGTTAPSGKYSVLDYNTAYTGSLANVVVNNATGMELTGGITDNTTDHRLEVTVSSTAQVRSWAAAGDGNWSAAAADAGNWSGGSGGQPNGPGATVTFGGGGTKTVTITDSDKIVGTMNIGDGYTIATSGENQLMTNTYTGTPTINVTGTTGIISGGFTPLKNTTIAVASASDKLTMSGFISNGAGITKSGAGTLQVDGEIGNTGTVTVSGGTLTLTANNVGSGLYTIASGATLNAFNSADGTGRSATGASLITNNGTLNIGDATHTNARIRGTITTTGAGSVTNVSAGSLAIQAVLNAQTVTGGGTVTGTGWGGGITVQGASGGGTINPGGINAVGVLNANGVVNFNPTTAATAGTTTLKIDCDGTGCDRLSIANNAAATLVFPNTATQASNHLNVVVNDLGGLVDGTYTIIDFLGAAATATNFNATSTTVSGPAGHTYSLALSAATAGELRLTVAPPGVGAGGAVPEPSTLVLLSLCVAAFATGRRRAG